MQIDKSNRSAILKGNLIREMNMTSTKESKNTTEETQAEDHGHVHVHGPNCNHGHHHHEALKPITRDAPKVGRNDPCTCGSQKKFKKCCGM